MTDFPKITETEMPTQVDVDQAIARARRMRSKAMGEALVRLGGMLRRVTTVRKGTRRARHA